MKSIDRHSPTAWFAVMSSSKLHLNGIQTKWDRIQLWWPQSPIVVKPEEDNAHAQIIVCDKMSAEKKKDFSSRSCQWCPGARGQSRWHYDH